MPLIAQQRLGGGDNKITASSKFTSAIENYIWSLLLNNIWRDQIFPLWPAAQRKPPDQPHPF